MECFRTKSQASTSTPHFLTPQLKKKTTPKNGIHGNN